MKRQRSQEEKARSRLIALYDSNEDEDSTDFTDLLEESGLTVSKEAAKEPTFFVTVSLCML